MKSPIKAAVVHGFTGTGASVKEARENAVSRIEGLQEGYWTPKLVHHRGMTGVVYRELDGWSYFIIRPGDVRDFPCTIFEGKFEDAHDACRRHIAQNGWEHSDGDTLPEVLKRNPEKDQRDFVYWARWQVAYRAGINQGMDDNAARNYAASH